MSFRTKLIKLLGGYTRIDCAKKADKAYNLGKRYGSHRTAVYLITYAKSIYGNSADDWANKVYKEMELFIDKECKKVINDEL